MFYIYIHKHTCVYMYFVSAYVSYVYTYTYRNKKVFLQNDAAMNKNHFSAIVATKHYGAASRKVKMTIQS